MDEVADRYRKVAATFTARVEGVPADGWDAPTPCEGWVARDVVQHLVDWVPAFFGGIWGAPTASLPSAADDPVAAWQALDSALQAALDDPAVAGDVRDTSSHGPKSFAEAFDTFALSDVLIHTWDLARATGQDERLDPDECERLAAGITPELDAALRAAPEHFGPRVEVPDDADAQTRVLAFMGRRP